MVKNSRADGEKLPEKTLLLSGKSLIHMDFCSFFELPPIYPLYQSLSLSRVFCGYSE